MPAYEYGEPVPVHQTSPFLGQLSPGELLQVGLPTNSPLKYIRLSLNGHLGKKDTQSWSLPFYTPFI